MSTRILAILVGVVLAGCGQVPPKPPLMTAVTGCDTTKHPSGKPAKCTVDINPAINGDGSCTVSAPDLVLSGGQHARIVWNLPTDYKFCTFAGDGAYPKSVTQNQFSNGAATDSPDGDDDATSGCKKHYRLDDVNSDHMVYEYSLQFHYFLSGNVTVLCRYDPQIRNG